MLSIIIQKFFVWKLLIKIKKSFQFFYSPTIKE